MLKAIARAMLRRFETRYDYDVSYMRAMLDRAPGAFFKFARINALARHRQAAPKPAHYAAKIMGAMAEDCGPCTQLAVDMAREAGVAARDIEAVLRRDTASMSEDAAVGFRFADAILARSESEDDARDAVRARWGEAAVVDLTLALQVGRLFPMVKAGLGYAKECRRINVDGAPVDVKHRPQASAAA